jgi:hypothetical protein
MYADIAQEAFRISIALPPLTRYATGLEDGT